MNQSGKNKILIVYPYRFVRTAQNVTFRDKKCDKCDAAFSKIEYLKYHKENAHSNIEFNCEATPEISEGIFFK